MIDPTDHTIDIEFAYTSWHDSCQDMYGFDAHGFFIQCRRPAAHAHHHAAGFGNARVRWEDTT